jgi:tetratricopeptide (TPR) repeat protein
VIVAAAGWFVWSKYMATPPYDPSATQAILVRANSLAKRQHYDQAIALLGDVKPADPQHDRALEMIADMQHKKAQAAQMVNGRPASAVYDESLAAGRRAFEAHDYDTAKTALDTAARIKPLPPDAGAMYATASQQVAKLEVAKALFRERRYQDAVTNLDPLLQSDPQNQSMRRMLISAHFDLGATALQEERLPDAMREFDEVLKSDPNDELAKRSRTLAERYSGQPKDLLYKIYVKYLPLRN